MPASLVAIGVPTYGQVHINWALARAHLQLPLGASSADLIVQGKDIATARNEIVERALSIGAKYLFFIDDDVLVPQHGFLSLYSRRKPVVTGVYWSKTHPPQPMIFHDFMGGPFYEWHVGEFFKIAWGCCGCVLIDVKEVFSKISKPYFSTDYLFSEGQEQVSSRSTEDLYFYTKLKQAGIDLWCDTTVQCLHIDRNTGQAFGLPSDWPQANPKMTIELGDSDKLVADLGAGQASPWFNGAKVVRFDINEDSKPDVLCDLRNIPEEDEKYDIVHARHVLEHFKADEIPKMLNEQWLRILKTGGKLILSVPNFEEACKAVARGEASEYNYWQIYGKQDNPFDFHKTGFTMKSMQRLMNLVHGIKDVNIFAKDGNIIVTAIKEKHNKIPVIETELKKKKGMVKVIRKEGQNGVQT